MGVSMASFKFNGQIESTHLKNDTQKGLSFLFKPFRMLSWLHFNQLNTTRIDKDVTQSYRNVDIFGYLTPNLIWNFHSRTICGIWFGCSRFGK